LVSLLTKSIAKGASRTPLDLLTQDGRRLIYNAWTKTQLNGKPGDHINPDLTSDVDITKAKRLAENTGVAFQEVKLTGPFDITGSEAREFLLRPLNPNGQSNADVIARFYDIDDVVGRDSDRWVVDFGTGFSEGEAALYEAPFRIVTERVVPFRKDPDKSRSTERRLKEK
jgi:hypothetical protein